MTVYLPPNPRPPDSDNDPILVKPGVLQRYKRTGPRQPCESPLVGIVPDGKDTSPCMETTKKGLVNHVEALIDAIVYGDLGLTPFEWSNYVNELLDPNICPDGQQELLALTNGLGLPPIIMVEPFRSKHIARLKAALYSSESGRFKNEIWRSFQWVSRYIDPKTGKLTPSCSDITGTCCLYTNYIDDTNKSLLKNKKRFDCLQDVTEDMCAHQTKECGGDFDGYHFYPTPYWWDNLGKKNKPKSDDDVCMKCTVSVQHLVYCLYGSPFIITNQTLQDVSLFKNEYMAEYPVKNLVIYDYEDIDAAYDDFENRSNTDSCKDPDITPTTTTPTEPPAPPVDLPP